MKIIETSAAPKAVGPYSQAVKVGNLIYTSGQIPIDVQSGSLVEGCISIQTERVIENLKAVLNAENIGLEKVVKTTCFLKNINDFAEFNKVYEKYFVSRPARSCVEVANLPKGALVEIEVIAEI